MQGRTPGKTGSCIRWNTLRIFSGPRMKQMVSDHSLQ